MSTYSFPWNQVNSLVQDFVVPAIRDQFFKSNAFYYRAKDRIKMYSGGRTIVHPLSWKAEGGGGGWFATVDRLDTTVRDPIQSAKWVAKNAYVPISIDWDEERAVQGPTMVKPLVEAKSELAKTTMIDLIGTNLFNDGSNPKAITGLQYALKEPASSTTAPTMTYGGISRSSTVNTWWNANGDSTAYTCAAGNAGGLDPLTAGAVGGKLQKMWGTIQLASAKTPTMVVGNVGCFNMYHNSLMARDNYMHPQQNTDLAKAGYDNLMYHRAVWVVDERAPRTAAGVEKLYFLNEDTVRLFVHSDANMAFEPFRKPHDQMARVAYILWRGELCIIEPRANGVFGSIDTSAVS